MMDTDLIHQAADDTVTALAVRTVDAEIVAVTVTVLLMARDSELSAHAHVLTVSDAA